jgi:putative ABC transport system permease protein
MRYFPLMLKNSWRNRRRTLLTVFSIAVSLCLLGVLMAIYHAFYLKDTPPSQALRLITRHRVSLALVMPASYGPKIRQVPGVKEVMRSQWFGGVYKDKRDPTNFFARFAVEQERLFALRPEMELPEQQKQDFLRERTACLIGKSLADKLNLKVGDRIALQGDIFPVNLDLTLRGIFTAPENDEVLYFHFAYLEESLPPGRRDFAGTFNIMAQSPEEVPLVAQRVDELFHNSTVETKTESERQFQLSFVSFLGNVKVFLLSVCAAVTFTILLVSANTMAMSVRERIREMAILKTLGFTPRAVMGIVIGEAVIIAIIGGALGLFLASFATYIVRAGPAFNPDLKTLTIQPSVALVSFVVAVSIGIISSFIPAWSASRTSIIEAIRNAG